MADKNPDRHSSDSAEMAMNRVLQAERDAELAIVECEKEAGRIIQEAQQQANRIASRTDERISFMKMRVSQRIAGDIKALERAEKLADEKYRLELDETGLAECIREIALLLSGGERSADNHGDDTG